MSESVIHLVLWVPFALVFLVSSILFVIAGYRRGVLNALVSLGGTVGAAVLSLAIARLVAPLLAPVLLKVLPVVSPEAMQTMGAAIEGIINGVVAMVVALALFMVVMLIITPVCKILLKRFIRLPAGNKKMKWGGFAVRVVDAALFAFLLLAPIYGTLYNYLPVFDAVMQMQPEQDLEFAGYLNAAKSHPVVKLSGFGPADWVYKGLSQITSDSVSVNATTLTATVQDMAALMEEVKQEQTQDGGFANVTKKLLTYARDNLLEQKWCSELIVNVGTDYLKQQIAASGGDSDLLAEVLGDLSISPEQFQQDGKDILDIAISVMDLQSGGNATEQDAKELAQKLGAMLTDNNTVKQLKQQVYTKSVTKLLGDSSQETVDAIQSQLNSVELTPEEQLVEAQAFLQLLTGGDQESALEALQQIGVLSSDLLPAGK